MKKTTMPVRRKSDTERREKQARRLVRVLQVHRATHCCRTTDNATIEEVADALEVATRTVYRDVRVLRKLYEIIGTDKLDP